MSISTDQQSTNIKHSKIFKIFFTGMSYVIYVSRKTFVSEALQESCYLKVHKRWTPTRLSFVFLRKNYLKSPKGRR